MGRLAFFTVAAAAFVISGFGLLADPVDTRLRLEDKLDELLVALARMFEFVARPEPFSLVDGPDTPGEITGQSVDGSLQNSLRHEAGFSKRASARKV